MYHLTLTLSLLRQFKEEVTYSEEVFNSRVKLVNQIIRRMIKHDGSIIVVDRPDSINYDLLPNDDKLLRLHPSYQG